MRRHDSRLARVQKAIDDAPVRRKVLREAYEWFWMFGELPDDDHVAFEVVRQALCGGEEQPLDLDEERAARNRKAGAAYWRRGCLPDGEEPETVRDRLFGEALFEKAPMRDIARVAIETEVLNGGNVASPGFASRHGMPMHASAAMHVLGYPQKWAVPPYEFQAQRLFARFDDLRCRIPEDDAAWLEEQVDAIRRFYVTGELPEDDLRVEVLLAHVELDQLIAHKGGKDVAEAMALFDLASRRDEEERDDVLAKIYEMAIAGQLR